MKELDGFAYISVEQVVNHILAIGMDLLTFQKEDDWTNEEGEYEGTYYRDLHMIGQENVRGIQIHRERQGAHHLHVV